jgi:hypothetical protein
MDLPETRRRRLYAERTRDGTLRTPSWRGLRPDIAPRDVMIEEEN